MNLHIKITLIVLIAAFSFAEGYSQSRTGYSLSEIKNEFSHRDQHFGFTDSGTPTLTVDFKHGAGVYFFNEMNICSFFCLVPHNNHKFRELIIFYNQNYVPISDTVWKVYDNEGVITIEIQYLDNGDPYFMFTID